VPWARMRRNSPSPSPSIRSRPLRPGLALKHSTGESLSIGPSFRGPFWVGLWVGL
jgi:hypothetical protein